jgi:hypothetical protein
MLETRVVDLGFQHSATLIREIDRGVNIVTLGGVHPDASCYSV